MSDTDAELMALTTIVRALASLDASARARVQTYVGQRFGEAGVGAKARGERAYRPREGRTGPSLASRIIETIRANPGVKTGEMMSLLEASGTPVPRKSLWAITSQLLARPNAPIRRDDDRRLYVVADGEAT